MIFTYMGSFAWILLLGTTIISFFFNRTVKNIVNVVLYILYAIIAFNVGQIVGDLIREQGIERQSAYAWGCFFVFYLLTTIASSVEQTYKVPIKDKPIVIRHGIKTVLLMVLWFIGNICFFSSDFYTKISSITSGNGFFLIGCVVMNVILYGFAISVITDKKYERIMDNKKAKRFANIKMNGQKVSLAKVMPHLKKQGLSKDDLLTKSEMRSAYIAGVCLVLFMIGVIILIVLLDKSRFDNTYSFMFEGSLSDFSGALVPLFVIIWMAYIIAKRLKENDDDIYIDEEKTSVQLMLINHVMSGISSFMVTVVLLVIYYLFFAIGWQPAKLQFVGTHSWIIGTVQHAVYRLQPILPSNLNVTYVVPNESHSETAW